MKTLGQINKSSSTLLFSNWIIIIPVKKTNKTENNNKSGGCWREKITSIT